MSTATSITCYHCGEKCDSHKHDIADKSFCCTGCRSVFLLLNSHELDNYYCLNEQPGAKVAQVQPEKFRFLDDEVIIRKLLSFSNEEQSQVTFYLPQIHCSSCLWLLEHLDKINSGIISSRVNFANKEVTVSYQNEALSLRQLAELLTNIGYEPHVSMQHNDEKKQPNSYSSRNAAYKLGITGFCFANIMLISFPEYLGMNATDLIQLTTFFRYVNLLLALPVVIYGASEFFKNALFSFRQKYINIDAPIALAISVTFIRSVYEILSGTGSGYLDSMSGIVFFMLLGRTLQNRSYSTLSFNRDYKSYFPIAITVIKEHKECITYLQEIKEHDVLRLHHQEVVPTDCMLSKGKADIDYSFITGESIP
jgi:Cu+-exporting ATPase